MKKGEWSQNPEPDTRGAQATDSVVGTLHPPVSGFQEHDVMYEEGLHIHVLFICLK